MCDAREDFRNTGLGSVTRYALSDLRILKTGTDSSITKMYMFGQRENTTTWMNYLVKDQLDNRNVLSVHTVDGSHDQGITVLDSACWNNMVSFFQTIQVVNEITIDSQNPTLKTLPAPVKVIAYLNVL